jgi:hypothetical protein
LQHAHQPIQMLTERQNLQNRVIHMRIREVGLTLHCRSG